jgi:uncharacterized oligopeptide transporter (OPT) family protein
MRGRPGTRRPRLRYTKSSRMSAVPQLSEEQTRTWTRDEKDRWWLRNVYRGDLPQLTIRSGVTGFLLGGILCATNLYVGAKTGVTLGVGVTSVILAFASFRLMSRAGLAKDFTILENNAMQSIATAAGYMTSPLVSSLAAYMLVAGRVVSWWQMILWNVVIAILGVLMAFPMKRRFINEEQLPFPEGRAAGVVLAALYSSQAKAGMVKARVLAGAATIAGAFQFITSEGWMRLVQFKLLHMDRWAHLREPWYLRERIDDYYYLAAAKLHLAIPRILGIDVRQLGLRVGIDFAMFGVGGLMGIHVATSVLLGALVNFAVLAPIMIRRGDIVPPISRIDIVNQWSLWWAVAMMVVGSLVGLFGKPQVILGAFRGLVRKRPEGSRGDVLRHIELPLWVSFAGVPVFGALGAWMAHAFFGARWILALASLPLIFVLALIATNSMALTSWTPTGAMAKITQFAMGAIDRSNPGTNLSTAGMTGEVASNASNLLSDIKPGYMLGAKPRQQAMGHVIGIVAGALASVPLFYLLFLPRGASSDAAAVAAMVSDRFGFPAALQWKGVAELIARGLRSLPASGMAAMAIAAVLAALFEVLRIVTRGRFWLSPVSIGLGVVLPPDACLGMWVGAMFFDVMRRRHGRPEAKGHHLWVESADPIAAGLIAGAALVGIGNAILNVVLA